MGHVPQFTPARASTLNIFHFLLLDLPHGQLDPPARTSASPEIPSNARVKTSDRSHFPYATYPGRLPRRIRTPFGLAIAVLILRETRLEHSTN